ncbi:Arginase/deacetylase [Paxillus ammoniavirescens]|nr:Arginase/deacetylase [Paxillus ammoniavirescens]
MHVVLLTLSDHLFWKSIGCHWQAVPVTTPGSSVHEGIKHTAIFIQDECLKHRFIRSRDTSGIVERPERLRAIKVGLAAAISRIEEADSAADTGKLRAESGVRTSGVSADSVADELAAALESMDIAPTSSSSQLRTSSVSIRRASTTVELLKNSAVKYVHGDIDGDVYLQNLVSWARDSQENITKKGSEIPEGIPPLDLYLCPSSIDAIQGAIGAVQEAVDAVIQATGQRSAIKPNEACERAFVAIRPPGHHCGEDTPSGFCFVNNVAIGAAHAHLNHGIQRIVILDIDLHHGNGTQSIVWQINEETYRQTLESEVSPGGAPPTKPGPRIYYGSLHDVLSFPCEDGKAEMVQAASTSIHGPHGQYIENIHLQKYNSDAHFWDILYPQYYLSLLHRAREFLDKTGGPGDDVIIFISCGFDACEHEYPSMSRHNRKVPVSFFIDSLAILAHSPTRGYSDRALTSGAMAHLCGLADIPGRDVVSDGWVNEDWWNVDNLVKLEKATKPRKASSRPSLTTGSEEWLSRTAELLPVLDVDAKAPSPTTRNLWVLPTSRTLRERKKPNTSTNNSGTGTPDPISTTRKGGSGSTKVSVKNTTSPSSSITDISTPLVSDHVNQEPSQLTQEGDQSTSNETVKKLPRVILHVRPPPDTTS